MKELELNGKTVELVAELEARRQISELGALLSAAERLYTHSGLPRQKPASTVRKQPLLESEKWDLCLPEAFTLGQRTEGSPQAFNFYTVLGLEL